MVGNPICVQIPWDKNAEALAKWANVIIKYDVGLYIENNIEIMKNELQGIASKMYNILSSILKNILKLISVMNVTLIQ